MISKHSITEIKDNVLKSVMSDLDTNNFLLSVTGENGDAVYSGVYSERPDNFSIAPGVYIISLKSREFTAPDFDEAFFGDSRLVEVKGGTDAVVYMECAQMSAGLKIHFGDSFVNKFSGKGVTVRDSLGSVFYSYGENRYCNLWPGKVGIYYNSPRSGDSLVYARIMKKSDMLKLNLSYIKDSGAGGTGFKIKIDTSRNWMSEDYNAGLSLPAGTLTIEQAKLRAGTKDVSVFGYIIGGDATSASFRTGPPFMKSSNIVIASSVYERNRNNCFVVELPSGSKVREGLNLVVHPKLVGSAVVVTGCIANSYYGYVGVKGTKSYFFL
ncbi:MAG: DUF4493 domain-containing protein [Bacteroidales bacterium]|jgi:hypothetical protein|nr:DUF4493 domain-containing protein [Bacteroidales bacterium]